MRRGNSGTDKAGFVGRRGDEVGIGIVPSVSIDGSASAGGMVGGGRSTYPLL